MHIHLCMHALTCNADRTNGEAGCQTIANRPATSIPHTYSVVTSSKMDEWMNGWKIPNHSLSLFEFHLSYLSSWWCNGPVLYHFIHCYVCKLSLDGTLSSVWSSRSSLLGGAWDFCNMLILLRAPVHNLYPWQNPTIIVRWWPVASWVNSRPYCSARLR